MGYVKYKDNPKRREPLGGRDHIQHIETALQRVVPDPGQITVGTPDGTRALSSLEITGDIGRETTRYYVNSVHGDNSNNGLSATQAKKTIGSAVAAIKSGAVMDATVEIHAPAHTPTREAAGFAVAEINTGGTVRFVSQVPGQKWHAMASTRITSGWAHDGDGVYSRAITLARTNAPIAWVPTLKDRWGQPTRIYTKNTATPTTPAPGEYGYSGGTYYIHLPGDVDPNEHTVEIAHADYLIFALNNSTVVIRDGDLRGAQIGVVNVGSSAGETAGAGTIHAFDTDASFSADSAFRTSQYVKGLYAVRCRGMYCRNDGFNHHCVSGVNAPLMELIDCEAAWNDDDGASPHETTRMIIRGGVFHHNGSSGFSGVNASDSQIIDAEFHSNLLLNPNLTGAETGGVNLIHTARMATTNLYTHDHPGPGVRVDTGTGATWIDNGGTRSGTAHGNGAPDQV